MAERARIVLLAADGLTGPQIAERVGCTEPTVVKWRRQYAADGLAGLEDAPRPGRCPRTVLTDEAIGEILSATVTPPPESLRAAGIALVHRRLAVWLCRAKGLQVSHDSIARLWRRFCLAPHRTKRIKFFTDPRLEAKVGDVVGSTCTGPDDAVVVCVDREMAVSGAGADPAGSCRCARAVPRAAGPRLCTGAGSLRCSLAWSSTTGTGDRRLLHAPPRGCLRS